MPEELSDAKEGLESASGPAAESSPAQEVVDTKESEQTPAEANSAQTKEDSKPFHEHPRFQELIQEKNTLKDQLSKMERVLQEKLEAQKPSPYDTAKQKMVKLGIAEDAAQELIDSMKMVSNAAVESRVQPIEQSSVDREVNSWVSDFSKQHEDFEGLRPQMYETFSALPDTIQQLIASHPIGVQLMYDHVKAQNMDKQLKSSYQKGVEEGYKNKQNKSSLTSSPTGSKNPPGVFTRKAIAEMSTEEYKKNRDAIMKQWSKLAAEGEQSGVI